MWCDVMWCDRDREDAEDVWRREDDEDAWRREDVWRREDDEDAWRREGPTALGGEDTYIGVSQLWVFF